VIVVNGPMEIGYGTNRPDSFWPTKAIPPDSSRRNGIIPPVSCLCETIGLETGRGSARIKVTHSPCLSRFAVTHIKGEFFYCDLPTPHAATFHSVAFLREERR